MKYEVLKLSGNDNKIKVVVENMKESEDSKRAALAGASAGRALRRVVDHA